MQVVIADDHVIVREGLKSLIINDLKLDVVGEADNGLDAIKQAELLRPDLIIMDIAMPEMDGIQAAAIIKERFSKIHIIILSMHANNTYVRKALKAGVSAFILKDSAFEELTDAIRVINDNKRYLSNVLVNGVIEDYLEQVGTDHLEDYYNTLTSREKEVFYLITRGYSREKISDQLSVSPRTIDQHKQRIKEKLDMKTQDELISFAKRLEI